MNSSDNSHEKMNCSGNSHEEMNCSGNSHEEMNSNNNCDCNSPNCSCNINSILKIDDVKPNIHIEMFNRDDDINIYLHILDNIYNNNISYSFNETYVNKFIYTISELLLKYYPKNGVIQYYIYDKKNNKTLFSFNILDIMIRHLRKNVDYINNDNKDNQYDEYEDEYDEYDEYDEDDEYEYDEDELFNISIINAIKQSIKSDGILNIVTSYDGYLSSLIPISDDNNIVHKIYNMNSFFSSIYGSSYEMEIVSIPHFIRSIKYYCTRFNYELPQYFEYTKHINEVLEKNYFICDNTDNMSMDFLNDYYYVNITHQEVQISFKNQPYDSGTGYLNYIVESDKTTEYGKHADTIHINNENYSKAKDYYENLDYNRNDYDSDDDYYYRNDSDDEY